LRSAEEEFHMKDMTEASKKNFETNRENNKIRRQSEREA
jgi:hypothetical protein